MRLLNPSVVAHELSRIGAETMKEKTQRELTDEGELTSLRIPVKVTVNQDNALGYYTTSHILEILTREITELEKTLRFVRCIDGFDDESIGMVESATQDLEDTIQRLDDASDWLRQTRDMIRDAMIETTKDDVDMNDDDTLCRVKRCAYCKQELEHNEYTCVWDDLGLFHRNDYYYVCDDCNSKELDKYTYDLIIDTLLLAFLPILVFLFLANILSWLVGSWFIGFGVGLVFLGLYILFYQHYKPTLFILRRVLGIEH